MNAVVKKWLAELADPDFPDEFEAKQLLNLFGIATPRNCRLGPDETAASIMLHPPYVAKVCSGRILHKTDQRGVYLNLDGASLKAAVNDLHNRFPEAAVLVEEQVRFQGTEFIVGALVDPGFGPAVMAGTGGILTELYEDVAFRLAPCAPKNARNMLDELTVSPLFSGFRGIRLDADALALIISQAGELAVALGPLFGQLDINPVVYAADGRWTALDAKLVLQDRK